MTIEKVTKILYEAKKVLELKPIINLPKNIKNDPRFCVISIANALSLYKTFIEEEKGWRIQLYNSMTGKTKELSLIKEN